MQVGIAQYVNQITTFMIDLGIRSYSKDEHTSMIKAYYSTWHNSSLETGKGLRELSHRSWQTWSGPHSSLMQSPETEHSPQNPNWRDCYANAGSRYSPAANYQEPSRQEEYPNQYIYGHLQV